MTSTRTDTTRRPRAALAVPLLSAAALAAGALGAGCAEAASGPDRPAVQQVTKAAHPTPAEVVKAAGAPGEVARSGNGSLLLAYYAHDPEGGEDGAVAWRVYDRGGRLAGEHAQAGDGSWRVHGVAKGFVFGPGAETKGFFVDTRARKHALKRQQAVRPVKKGDVLVSELEPTLAYRPSTGTLAPLGGLPGDVQHVAVDERGTTWTVPMWGTRKASVTWRRATGGSGRHTFTLTGRTAPQAFAAHGGTAVVSVAQDETEPDPGVRGLVLTTDRGATWRTVKDSARLPLSRLTAPSLDVLDDGRVLIGERDRGYWLAERGDNRSFRRLARPVAFDEIVPLKGVLYGIAEGKGLWTSKDEGRTWSRFRPGGVR